MTARRFTAALTPAPEGGFVARCLEAPVTTQGETIDEARANLREAVELYLETAGDDAEVSEPPIIAPFDVAS